MEPAADAPVNDDMEDPKHLKDLRNPCSWCGAKWITPPHPRHDRMLHDVKCPYIVAGNGMDDV